MKKAKNDNPISQESIDLCGFLIANRPFIDRLFSAVDGTLGGPPSADTRELIQELRKQGYLSKRGETKR